MDENKESGNARDRITRIIYVIKDEEWNMISVWVQMNETCKKERVNGKINKIIEEI